MKKKNVLVITGTRADYGLLKPVFLQLQKSKKLSPKFLITGMHTLKKFGYTIAEIKKDKFPIAAIVKISEKDDMLQSFAKETMGIRNYCTRHKVDFILLLGDRDEMLAGAVVAAHLKIPIAHIAGGDVTGYLVDSFNRHVITKFSHLHFTTNEGSYKKVLAMGENPKMVFNVGHPGLDVLNTAKFLNKKELSSMFKLNERKQWFLLLQHPTPFDITPFQRQIHPVLQAVRLFDAEVIIFYPNSDTGSSVFIKEIERFRKMPHVRILKNVPRELYLSFLKHASVLIGNSSSGIMETPSFKLPVLNVGSRQKGRIRAANVVDVDYSLKSIQRGISKALSFGFRQKCKRVKSPYGSGNASNKIAFIMEKWIDHKNLFFKE